MTEKLKVVISGIQYPVSMMGYFIRAFERRTDVELVTAGSFSGAYIPWNNGMQIPQRYVKTPTIPLPYPPQPTDPIFVEHQLPWSMPDLWIQFDAGFHFTRRPNATVSVAVGTDPHVLSDSYKDVRAYSDKFFNMQLVYKEPKDIYLPYAFDPILHAPLLGTVKKYDACLIGLQYDQRNTLIRALEARHHKVHYSIGEVYDEFQMRYNESRVALNWSSLDDLNARTFEAMGMGIPLVTNRVTDLANFFVEGEHYLGFGSAEEGVLQVERLLKDHEFAFHMADNASRKVWSAHTYDDRVNQILKECKLI